jgi:hypothetical protein
MSLIGQAIPLKVAYNVMVTNIVFKGGLGNQLFQWAYVHSIIGNNKFYPCRFHFENDRQIRGFELSSLLIQCPHVHSSHERQIDREFLAKLFEYLYEKFKTSRRLLDFIYLEEDPRKSNSKKTRRRRFISGYFQNSSYFEEGFENLLSEISPILKSVQRTTRNRVNLPANYSVIHIRTGDYFAFENKNSRNFIGSLSDEYFLSARNFVKSEFVILVTENQEVIHGLTSLLKPELVLDKKVLNAWETLSIMAHASEVVIANSTLSWWGGRLAQSKGATIYMPSAWDQWGDLDMSDYHIKGAHYIKSSWSN